jgi:hypothetical protein
MFRKCRPPIEIKWKSCNAFKQHKDKNISAANEIQGGGFSVRLWCLLQGQADTAQARDLQLRKIRRLFFFRNITL